ncbi:hypothetical protein [Pseudomonas piscis]|uniref:hypothetical protein n=1 Tax=Pseudomonas piscis TaxID=2614538 RepID=UPI0021D56A2C|nr:hypothetical protein [Pseudomonas piscis]MCU7645664.1 hypothetical protein [Pseudomonas piscis]
MADDRIGLILHLSEHDYRKISETWAFALPDTHEMHIEQVMKCRYVAFAVNGRWKSIASISAWQVKLGLGIHIAELSKLSSSVTQLMNRISNPEDNKWLNNYQKEAVESAMEGEEVVKRPDVIPPCLDLEEAAEAIVRRYGVDSSQIEISIHRRPQKQSQKAEPSACMEAE